MEKLRWLPNTFAAQTAGNIGFVALGAGYTYYKGSVVTQLLYGYVPESVGGISIHTLAFKQQLYPLRLQKDFPSLSSPIYLGFTANIGLGDQYMLFLKDRFRDYYWPSALRFSLFTGIEGRLPLKAVLPGSTGFYAEIGVLDPYLTAYFREDRLRARDVLGLAFGMTFLTSR